VSTAAEVVPIREVDDRPHAYTVWFRKMLGEFRNEVARFVSD